MPSCLNPEDPNHVLSVRDSRSYRCLVEQAKQGAVGPASVPESTNNNAYIMILYAPSSGNGKSESAVVVSSKDALADIFVSPKCIAHRGRVSTLPR